MRNSISIFFFANITRPTKAAIYRFTIRHSLVFFTQGSLDPNSAAFNYGIYRGIVFLF